VPGKNIKLLAGKPLIAWTVKAALQSPALDRVIVTTDSTAIAEIARNCGAEVPFLRPATLSADDTPGLAPILHAVNWLSDDHAYEPDAIVVLQPTSPFRPSSLIEQTVGLLVEQQFDAVLCLTPAKRHPYWMKTIVGGTVQPFLSLKDIPTRRQDLPAAYAISGSIYAWMRPALLRRSGPEASGATQFPDERVGAVVVDGAYSLDIDTELDFKIAECLARELSADEASIQ
jgi:N-acylneuraminate cytidylyltransferase/CMP-N,N'-diacetyllegionaminic acid synthase